MRASGSLPLVLLFVLFSSGWVATSNSDMTVFYFIFLYFILFDCHLLESCSFLMKDRKGVDLEVRGGEGNKGKGHTDLNEYLNFNVEVGYQLTKEEPTNPG